MNKQSYFRPVVAACVLIVGFIAGGAQAQVDADPLPGDPKLVVFQWDSNNSYRIFAKPMASTHIQLDDDERVKILALGDTAGWMTANRDSHVFVKPRYPNISTPGTLITNKRTYQFMFRSTTENGRWYQRVSFQNPSDMMMEATQADRRELAALASSGPALQEPVVGPAATVNAAALESGPGKVVGPESLNFSYDIQGDNAIRPLTVYDDGFATYLQLRQAEDVPAVFRLLSGTEIELLEYVLKGNTLVIPRILEAGMLKLGNMEVRFFNQKKVSKKFFSSSYNLDGVTK